MAWPSVWRSNGSMTGKAWSAAGTNDLLRLEQSGFGCPVLGHFGLQTHIGLVQLNLQPHRLIEDPVELPAADCQRCREDDRQRAEHMAGRRTFGDEPNGHRQSGREHEGEQGRNHNTAQPTPQHTPADREP